MLFILYYLTISIDRYCMLHIYNSTRTTHLYACRFSFTAFIRKMTPTMPPKNATLCYTYAPQPTINYNGRALVCGESVRVDPTASKKKRSWKHYVWKYVNCLGQRFSLFRFFEATVRQRATYAYVYVHRQIEGAFYRRYNVPATSFYRPGRINVARAWKRAKCRYIV